MGALGRRRAYILCPAESGTDGASALKLPSDLAGIVTATYDLAQAASGNIDAALDIEETMSFLVENLVTEFEKQHLRALSRPEAFRYSPGDTFRAELSRLIGLGLIDRKPNMGLRGAMADHGPNNDLKRYLIVTPKGEKYLDRLEHIQAARAQED